MSARNRVLLVLGIVCLISVTYYLISTPRSEDLVLIGTVDSNQVVVSGRLQGRLLQLLVNVGSQVKKGDLIGVLDSSELEAEARAAAATIDGMRYKVAEMQATLQATRGSTKGGVANAQARLESARAQLLQAEATLQRTQSDSQRSIELAKEGVESDQDRVQAESSLAAQTALVQSLQQEVSAAEADLNTSLANVHTAQAAERTVDSTRAQVDNAESLLKLAEVRLTYTKIYAPVAGTVLVRAALQGEVLKPGQPIVTIVDPKDTWVRAEIPETDGDGIGLGEMLRIRLPGGTITSGKVFFKSVESDFATQRDVGRRKEDIRTVMFKVRLDNPNGAYVPGMTAEVLVSPQRLMRVAQGDTAAAEHP